MTDNTVDTVHTDDTPQPGQKSCEVCHKMFTPHHHLVKLCSPECRKIKHNATARGSYHRHKPERRATMRAYMRHRRADNKKEATT